MDSRFGRFGGKLLANVYSFPEKRQKSTLSEVQKPYPENALHVDGNSKTIEIPQRSSILKTSHCSKVHNAP